MKGTEYLGSAPCLPVSEPVMEPLMTKISILAALPLVLSLTIVPAAQAQPAHAWRDAYGSAVVLPHRDTEPHWQMRGAEQWFALPPAAAQPQDHVKDPFADLHFE
jgi:hypothetical protein